MIEASFDRFSRRAAIDGAYQYDTGQRLRLSGLPSPDELAEADDSLTGSVVTVQAHYGYAGDAQTDVRLAQWDEVRFCWLAEIPDEYLTRNEPVNVYVYVYYGESEYGSRSQTMYEGVFTPTYRPAPNNVASDDMLSAWAELEAEVDLALSGSGTAESGAKNAAIKALSAAEGAQEGAKSAQAACEAAESAEKRLKAVEQSWDGISVRVVRRPSDADARVTMDGGVLMCAVPDGAAGPAGEAGEDGPSDIDISFTDGILTITPK